VWGECSDAKSNYKRCGLSWFDFIEPPISPTHIREKKNVRTLWRDISLLLWCMLMFARAAENIMEERRSDSPTQSSTFISTSIKQPGIQKSRQNKTQLCTWQLRSFFKNEKEEIAVGEGSKRDNQPGSHRHYIVSWRYFVFCVCKTRVTQASQYRKQICKNRLDCS